MTTPWASVGLLCRLAHPDDMDKVESLGAFEFMNEGGANVVFRIVEKREHPYPVVFMDKSNIIQPLPRNRVLRVPKAKPTALRPKELLDQLEQRIKPLFPPDQQHFILDHEPVGLHFDVMAELDQMLNTQEDRTHPAALDLGTPDLGPREMLYLVALLVPNMEHRGPNGFTIEFKPKWLALSPNQRVDSLRCRTCALQRYRERQGKADLDKPYLCPLALLSSEAQIPDAVFDRYIRKMAHYAGFPNAPLECVQPITQYLRRGAGHDLLALLVDLQNRHDGRRPAPPIGTSVSASEQEEIRTPKTEEEVEKLCLAMTLRDCSIFLRVEVDDAGNTTDIECKIGDLDFKDSEKIPEWRDKERQLIDGGWYAGTEDGEDHEDEEAESSGPSERCLQGQRFKTP